MKQWFSYMVIVQVVILLCGGVKAQKSDMSLVNRSVFGIQFSPVIPQNFLEQTDVHLDHDTLVYDFRIKGGYVFGMEIRHYFTRRIAIQSGINVIKRKYYVGIEYGDSSITNELGSLGYEIPSLALIYVRISKSVLMNVAVGHSFTFFPSDLAISNLLYAKRNSWVQPSLTVNYGFDLEIKEHGMLYLGFTYQRLFYSVYKVGMQRPGGVINDFEIFSVQGSYLCLNLKYYFPT